MGKSLRAVAGVAIAIGIAVAAPALAPALLAALGTTTATALATAAATAAIAAGLSIAAGFAMQALAPKPAATKAAPINFRQAIGNSWIIIGKRRHGGQMVFFHPRKVGKDHYRYFVFASAGHRCAGVLRWWLNDEVVTVNPSTGAVTSGAYAGAAWLWFERGMEDAAAHATLVAECGGKWTAVHRGRGVAKIYAKFRMTKDVVTAGMPTVSAEWQGADEIEDPRTGTKGYTDLAIPAFYWWMRLPREEGGFGISVDELPDPALLAAWTGICDETVPLAAGGTEKRYTFNSLIETGATPSEVRATFVVGCAGTFAYTGGQHWLRPGYWNPPSTTLHEDDLSGPITLPTMLPGEEVATEVQTTFIDPATNYQPQPAPVRSVPSTDIRQITVDLPHCTSSAQAQRIAEIMLRRTQCEKRPGWPMNIMGLACRAMDTVQLGTARYGLSNYAFVVDDWGMTSDYNVRLGLREENADIYEWAATDEKPLPSVPLTAVAEAVVDDDVALLKVEVGTQGESLTDLRARVAALENPEA